MGNGYKERSFFPLTSLQIGDLQSYLSHLSLFLAPESKKLYILVDNQPWLNELVHRPTHLWQLMVTKSRLSPFANTRRRKERKERKEMAISAEVDLTSDMKTGESEEMKTWFSLIDAATLSRKRALLDVNKLRNILISNSLLHRTLHGFIVFEIAWNDIRGMNYLNELQTATSLAVEAKVMKRWEFDSIRQAAKSSSLWFPGTINELILLKEYLDSTTGSLYFDAQENFPRTTATSEDTDADVNSCSEDGSPSCLDQRSEVSVENATDPLQTPHAPDGPYKRKAVKSMSTETEIDMLSGEGPFDNTVESATDLLQTPHAPDGPYKRKAVKSMSTETEIDMLSGEGPFDNTGSPISNNIGSPISDNFGSPTYSQRSYDSECDDITASQYKDVLVVFRFEDCDLPFKLKDIIMSNLRLLTLLEAGLPSWVLFLQSYPGFCHIYRPWMCPLARALYVLISTVTVLIGFYDLYKNVPLLKVTLSRLFGPFFDWIEDWEMIARIRYLGTMLFLHNLKKALQWLLVTTHAARSFLRIIAEPLLGPFVEFVDMIQPLCSACMQLGKSSFLAIWSVIEFSANMVGDFLEIIFLPIWYLLYFVWTTVISVLYPIFWTLREVIYVPIRLALPTSSFVGYIYTCLRDSVLYAYQCSSGLFKLSSHVSKVGSKVNSHDVSMWRSLWNDIFSQVFKAVRAILNGLVAFLVACNRHRLSIYNHALDFFRRLPISRKISPPSDTTPSESLLKVHKEEEESPAMMSKKIR